VLGITIIDIFTCSCSTYGLVSILKVQLRSYGLGDLYFMYMNYFPTKYIFSHLLSTEVFSDTEKKFLILFELLSFALSIALGGLFWFHTYLILTNQTTIEFYTNRYQHVQHEIYNL
jgi:multisubunit Na+/H+ antiporter MnhB subunit